jgi:transcriptional regulator of acetoin/glycerol metabolism
MSGRYHPHTLGLVRAAAQTVENRLFDSLHARHLRLRFHTMAEGIGTFSEGIAALSDEGSLIGANLAGRAFRGLRCGDLQARPLSSILPVRLEDLLDWNRRRPGEPMLVTLADDERLFMRIELPAGAGARVLAAGDRKARARNALDALDTGDERLAAAIEKAHKLIGKPIPLLLQGEHGVGKERFARALHDSGPRHDGPFVRFSGVGLSPEQIEATLFGPATGSGPEGPQGAVATGAWWHPVHRPCRIAAFVSSGQAA